MHTRSRTHAERQVKRRLKLIYALITKLREFISWKSQLKVD